jgi:iron complex outermembrane receptor protein
MTQSNIPVASSLTAHLLGGAALAVLVAALAPQAALAQTAATTIAASPPANEVVVTGSRIRGVAPVGSSLVNLSREAIVSAGPATTADILRTLPQIQGLGPSATAASAQNGAANVTRSTGLNLRGIGVDATLVLFDGQRLPPGGTQGQLVDPSVIPAIALQRIEVVPDGASAIYGSDAVAGVVNLITRKDFDGAEAMGRYGFANGYSEYQASGIIGRKWDTGSITASYEHTHNSDLLGSSRSFYSTYLTPSGGKDYRSNQCAPGNIVAGGKNYAIPAGGVTPATAGTLVAGTTNLCDNVKNQDIIPELSRDTLFLNGHQDLNDVVSMFAEGFFSRRTGVNITSRTSSLAVPSSNAFFVQPTGSALASETVNYNFGSVLGPYSVPLTSESYDAVGGFNFKLPASWKAQVSLSYGRSDDVSDSEHAINTSAVASALASSNPATALDVFGAAPTSAATLAAISNGYFIIKAHTGLTTANAQADGPVFQLPGGMIRLAVGTEYRHEDLVGDLINGSAVAPVGTFDSRSRSVVAGYGELYVPIVGEGNALPLVQHLNLSVAGRVEHYSDFGYTTNPKVGLTWVPIQDVNLRASYGTSFRAPSLSQSDPHSSGYGLYADTLPNLAGVNAYGIGIAGGNPNLQPETARTYSVGGDWTPSFLPGARASLTYFNVDYTNQIVTLRGTPGLTSQSIYSPYVIRNPTAAQIAAVLAMYPQNQVINASQVTFIADGRAQNVGTTNFSGLDFDVSYRWDWLIGHFQTGVTGTYFLDINTSVVPGATVFDGADLINYPQRLRGRFNLSWSGGPWSAIGYVNYVDGYSNNTVTPVQSVSAWTTVDLHVSYDFSNITSVALLHGFTVAVEAENLLNAAPPFVNISGGYDPQSASPIGRLISVSLDKKW